MMSELGLEVKKSKRSSKLKEFKPQEYYQLERDPYISSPKNDLVASLSSAGTQLIIDYYKEKYGTVISQPYSFDGDDHDAFLAEATTHIEEIRKAQAGVSEYREAFIIKTSRRNHDIPLIYIKEAGKEAIFLANSLGNYHGEYGISEFLAAVKLPIFVVEEARQADMFVCSTDALVFCRDATAKNEAIGQYKIPKLLHTLETRSTRKSEYISVARLPDEFLKTAQISEFVDIHKEEREREIHKREVLAAFRKRYSAVSQIRRRLDDSVAESRLALYAKRKSIKYINICEIQFYVQQLDQLLPPEKWTKAAKKQFIESAKAELRSQSEESTKINSSLFFCRFGLFSFAQRFLRAQGIFDIQKKKNISQLKPGISSTYSASPLYEAVLAGQSDSVKQLLAAGANPNQTCLLHLAAHLGHRDICQMLLAAGAELLDLEGTDTNERSALFYAVCAEQTDIVAALLEAGRPLRPIPHGEAKSPPLRLPFSDIPLLLEKLKCLPALREQFIKAGHGTFLLRCALKTQDREMLSILLDTEEAVGLALLNAVCSKDIEICKRLLEEKANPNFTDAAGRPLLAHAVLAGSTEICELLINAGAKANQPIKASAFGLITSKRTPLFLAIAHKQMDCACVLLKARAESALFVNNKFCNVLDFAKESGWHSEQIAQLSKAMSSFNKPLRMPAPIRI